jgi:nucleoside-diphosphate-sugar epimerase
MIRLIFGCGYLGERVARRWCEAGDDLVVVTRSVERARSFENQADHAIVADVTRPETLSNLPTAATVLFSVGHDRTSQQPITEVYAGGMRNVLAALPPDTGRFIYISTTGVYGDAKGWVDEQTPPDPQREGGRASLAAEQLLAAHPLGRRSIILRLAGIYGPGRVPFIEELRAGEPIPAPSAGHLNLIHVDDATAVVVAAAEIPQSKFKKLNREPPKGCPVYCVSDGHPVQRGEYYREVARQIGARPPQFVEPDPDSPRAARASADRRVRNDRMLADLRVTLAYRDYRAGLAALLETQNQQRHD